MIECQVRHYKCLICVFLEQSTLNQSTLHQKTTWRYFMTKRQKSQSIVYRLLCTSSGSISNMIGKMLMHRVKAGGHVSTVSILSFSSPIFVRHLLNIVQYWSLTCCASSFDGSLNMMIWTMSMNTMGSFNEECEQDFIKVNSCIWRHSGIGCCFKNMTFTPFLGDIMRSTISVWLVKVVDQIL